MYPIVYVEWLDAEHGAGNWVDIKECIKPLPMIKSAGFLVVDRQNYIVVATSVAGSDVAGEMTIPRKMIKKLVKLRNK